MKTVTINLYGFNELSDEAKEHAIQKHRMNGGTDMQFAYDDAYETVKKFHDIFGTNESRDSWLYLRTDHICDSRLSLQGLRLHKFLINNYYHILYPKKYIGHINKDIKHRMAKSGTFGKGYTFFYSHINREKSCSLTGMCYDLDMLKPMHDFIEHPTDISYEDLLHECVWSLKKSLEKEETYRNSDEFISEELIANDCYFDEYGNALYL
jgi:hypothetical protein